MGIFAGHRQHDTHDFMCSLLEQIDTEVNLTSEFSKIITGTTEIKRRCIKCQKRGPQREEPFTSLHIEFEENDRSERNVEETIRRLQQTEEFECPCKCGGSKSLRETKLKKLPEVLTMQIKRFVQIPEKNTRYQNWLINGAYK